MLMVQIRHARFSRSVESWTSSR